MRHPNSEVFCKVFEDNQSCIAVAKSKKNLPRIKQIAIKYHYLKSFVQIVFWDMLRQ